MRSPYTLDDPPPLVPPVAVVEATAWSVATDLWHDHQPDTLFGTDCARCRHSWPCPTWEVADGVIADVCASCPVPVGAGAGRSAVGPARHATGAPARHASTGPARHSTGVSAAAPVPPPAPVVVSEPAESGRGPGGTGADGVGAEGAGTEAAAARQAGVAARHAVPEEAAAAPERRSRRSPEALLRPPAPPSPMVAAPTPVTPERSGRRYRRGRPADGDPIDAVTDFLPRVEMGLPRVDIASYPVGLPVDLPILGSLPRH